MVLLNSFRLLNNFSSIKHDFSYVIPKCHKLFWIFMLKSTLNSECFYLSSFLNEKGVFS